MGLCTFSAKHVADARTYSVCTEGVQVVDTWGGVGGGDEDGKWAPVKLWPLDAGRGAHL